jgi:hypothetical protein
MRAESRRPGRREGALRASGLPAQVQSARKGVLAASVCPTPIHAIQR